MKLPKLTNPNCNSLFFAYFPNLHNRWIFLSIHIKWVQHRWLSLEFSSSFFTIGKSESLITKLSLDYQMPPNYQGLSTHSFSAAILPELRPPIFPNVPTAEDKPLKLLLPSLKFRDFLDFLNLEELMSPMSRSVSSQISIFATTSRAMVLRQNGQTGGVRHAVVGLGLLWQQRANVHCAHIWWPQFWTSIVHTCSKHMQQSSVSLTCRTIITMNTSVSYLQQSVNFLLMVHIFSSSHNGRRYGCNF